MRPADRAAPFAHDRAAFDWYVEPRWTVEALFDAHPMFGPVGDPACGLGTIPDVARARGFPIVAGDIVDRGYEALTAVADFLLDPSPFVGVPNIVTNPPYSYKPGIAEAFVRQAFALEAATVAVLVPLRWLASEMRFRLFNTHTPSRIYYFSQRPSMPPGHKLAELGDAAFRRGKTDYCWVVWERTPNGLYHGPAMSGWIEPGVGLVR